MNGLRTKSSRVLLALLLLVLLVLLLLLLSLWFLPVVDVGVFAVWGLFSDMAIAYGYLRVCVVVACLLAYCCCYMVQSDDSDDGEWWLPLCVM